METVHVTISVYTDSDLYTGRVRGVMNFVAIPRSGELVNLLLDVPYIAEEVAAGFTGQVRVLDVMHSPNRDGAEIAVELEPIYMPKLGQAFVIMTYLAQEFMLSFEPSEDLMGQQQN